MGAYPGGQAVRSEVPIFVFGVLNPSPNSGILENPVRRLQRTETASRH
jgi:hypothetical protein